MAKKKDEQTSSQTSSPILQTRTRMTDEQVRERMTAQGKTTEQIESAIRSRNEPKTHKFSRLANRRLHRAVNAILALKPLANASQYGYSDIQVNQLVNQLNSAVATVKAAFLGGSDGGIYQPI
jgi:hypothetical protein